MCPSFQFVFIITSISILSSLSLGYSDNHNKNLPQPHPEDVIESIPAPKPGWIDPFDMLGESRSRESLFVQSEVQMHVLQKRCSSYEIYLRRFVNMFLHAVELRDGPGLEHSMALIKLEFLIDGKDINTLKEFGQGDNSAPKIEVISDIFTKIFSQKTSQNRNIFFLSDILIWFQKAFLKVLSSPEWTVLSSVSLLLFLALWLVYRTHSYRLAIFTILLTIFLAGFGFTWIRMYEEMEVERYVNIERHGEIPRHCSSQSQTMAWYELVYSRMFGVDCHEFFKSRDVRSIVKISPTDVLAETISSMIINPATNIGEAYGKFVSSIIGELPWWLQPFALPVSLIVPVLFITILLAFLFNYRLSLSITGFHLMPTWSNTSQSGGRGQNQYVEDCSRRGTDSSQQNSTHIPFLDSSTPLFVMNWKGLKKLSTSSLLDEKLEKDKKEEIKESLNEDGQSLEDDSRQMMENLKEFEKFVETMETQKVIEERKKRNIHTHTVGESSLTNRRDDSQKSLMIEYTDLPSGDRNRTHTRTGKGKDSKDKTA